MRTLRKHLTGGVALAGLMTLIVGVGSAHAVVPHPSHCIEHLSGDQDGTLLITSTPAPGSPVAAGSTIDITATWSPSDWTRVEKMVVCVTVDGVRVPDLTGGQRPLDNAGSFEWPVPVPADMPEGSEICVRDVLMGDSAVDQPEQRSNWVCFRSAVTPTTTVPPADPEVVTQGNPGPVADEGVIPLEVAGTQLEPAPVSPMILAELPKTGAAAGSLVVLAGIALSVGGLALAFGRRRPVRS